MMQRSLSLLAALTLSLVSACADRDAAGSGGPSTGDDPPPQDAQAAVLDAFDDYQVVGGFSANHGNKDVDDFLLDLVRNPAFPATVDDIVLECGNALYQDVLDRYVAGEDVPLADVRQVWRNSGQPQCGFSSFTEALVPLVRRINEGLDEADKMRILAADPPHDWSQIDSPEDLEALDDRDGHIAAVMEQEVLAKDRKALLLFGINHVRHREGTAVGQYEANGYDGVTYVIDDHQGFGNQDPALREDNDELEARMADWPLPSIVEIEGSWLEELDALYFNDVLPGDDQETGNPGVDAYLYVGPRDTLLNELPSAQALTDQAYLDQRREWADRVQKPPDSPHRPETILARLAEAGVLMFDPDHQPGPPAGNGPADGPADGANGSGG